MKALTADWRSYHPRARFSTNPGAAFIELFFFFSPAVFISFSSARKIQISRGGLWRQVCTASVWVCKEVFRRGSSVVARIRSLLVAVKCLAG